ncbi:hypothetical protein [Lacticaseibacillus saniviri]|uniref:hypothetical protein n=1 Tax=Lacticaseibacillus saniviri TaxID=931533 RepID=UPI001CDAF4E4|nr:hypothetical protein [Lacticaseibacillus saniviri]
MDLKLIDNKGTNTLEQLIKENVTSDSKISIQTAAFSIFAFNALQKELKRSKELRVILTKSFLRGKRLVFLNDTKLPKAKRTFRGITMKSNFAIKWTPLLSLGRLPS